MQDEDEIRQLIEEHFEAMRWAPGEPPDWNRFRQDYLPEAQLFGTARPIQPRTLEGFIERMETVARANLQSFEEHTRKMKILRFGNVAVVLAMSELLENGSETSHDISGYLLVKSEGSWAIAAHAWDQAGPQNPVPEDWM
ncbi:nuclear transport factor 2 family protein [Roseibium sp.]|uniref:nuclear transport factor 2 family protein n=1 Tax=Roseibium sp. TaxID=1936156 RepID=UPI003D0CFB83